MRRLYATPLVLIGAVAVVVAAAAGGAPAADEPGAAAAGVLAAGDPALTRSGVERYSNFFEWLLDVPLTTEQRSRIEQSLREAWQANDREEIAGYVELLELEGQVSALAPAERVLVREQAQPEVLKELRGKAEDPGARWLLAIYEAGHRPIAPGQPPLTRQMTDAFVELVCFMLSEAAGQKLEASLEVRDDLAKSLAAGYPPLPAAEQAQFARMPLIWAAFGAAWPALPETEKAAYRRQFTDLLKPHLHKPKQAAAAAEAEARTRAQAAPQPAQGTAGQGYASTAAQAQYQQMMGNILRMQAETGRIFAANLGSSYTYQYRY